jgi:hypothetical protein
LLGKTAFIGNVHILAGSPRLVWAGVSSLWVFGAVWGGFNAA